MDDSKRTEELANTLKNSGLAASMSEALNMAKEMLGTGDKVQVDFEQRSDFISKKVDEMKKEKLGIKELKKPVVNMYEENKRGMVERAKNNNPLVINVDYEIPKNIKKEIAEDEVTLNEIMDEEAEKIYDNAEEEAKSEEPLKSEESEEELSVKEIETEPRQTPIEESAGPDIDLNKMFDFTNKPCD